jgi:alpha-methylacyl-CoA racemase
MADVVAAWSLATAVLAALHGRATTGEGAWIDQALLDAALYANVTGWAAEAGGAKAVGEALPLTGALPCYNLYQTRDGHRLAIGALEPHFWRRFCEAAGRRDLIRLQYADTARARREVARLVGSKSRDEWAALLATRDVPVEPISTAAEALAHPQVAAREVVRRGADGLLRLGYPARLDGHRPRAGERVPELGADTSEVLAEHGLVAGRSSRQLRAAGIGRRASLRRWLGKLLAGRT